METYVSADLSPELSKVVLKYIQDFKNQSDSNEEHQLQRLTLGLIAKLVLGAPRRNAKNQLGLWMECSLLDITLLHDEWKVSEKLFYTAFSF